MVTIIVTSVIAVNVVLWGLLVLYERNERQRITEENDKLEIVASEVVSCIDEGNYIRARSKASTIAFAGDDEKSKEKWDTVREELLKQIDRAEEADKSNNITPSQQETTE